MWVGVGTCVGVGVGVGCVRACVRVSGWVAGRVRGGGGAPYYNSGMISLHFSIREGEREGDDGYTQRERSFTYPCHVCAQEAEFCAHGGCANVAAVSEFVVVDESPRVSGPHL